MKKFFVLLAILAIGTAVVVAVGVYRVSDRQSDNLSKQNISDQKLPKPENFIQIKRDIQKGIFFGLGNLSEDYYLQPDFYPSFKSNISNHDYTRWGVHGYGAYPGEISYKIDNFKKGQYINIYTFLKAGDDIETFQGMKLDFDVSYNQNNQNYSRLFNITINPNPIMFSPTFPERAEYTVESRTYEWAYKLKITIIADTDVPSGTYSFKLKALPPDEDIQKLYYEDIQKINQKWYTCPEDENIKCDNNIVELRKKVYVNGGQIQADKFFNIIINVGIGINE